MNDKDNKSCPTHLRACDTVGEADSYAFSQGWEKISEDEGYRAYRDEEQKRTIRVRFVRNGPPETSYVYDGW